MNNKKRKLAIVKQLIDQKIEVEDENVLMEMLIDEPIAIDIDKYEDEKRTFGDKVADKITEIAGSWTFIICFTLFLITWIIINIFMIDALDPYPFILLNLLLSCIAALQAPIIMMSQNRAAKKDSLRSKNDYKTDLKSELILEVLHDQMNEILMNQRKILQNMQDNEKK